MDPQIRIIEIGSREFLQIEDELIPVDDIKRVRFNPDASVNDEDIPQIQINCDGGEKYITTGDCAVKVWKFLNLPSAFATVAEYEEHQERLKRIRQ